MRCCPAGQAGTMRGTCPCKRKEGYKMCDKAMMDNYARWKQRAIEDPDLLDELKSIAGQGNRCGGKPDEYLHRA